MLYGNAVIHRKVCTLDELKELTDGYKDNTSQFVVEKTIELDRVEYDKFCNSLLQDNDIVEQNKDCQFTDENGVWHCLLVKSADSNEAVAVSSSGYNYARYSAYIEDVDMLSNYELEQTAEQETTFEQSM